MLTALFSYIGLFILFWLGFALGHYFYSTFKQYELEEKLEKMKYELSKNNPVVKEIENKLDENRKYLETKSADLQLLMKSWVGESDNLIDIEKRLAQTTTTYQASSREISDLKKKRADNDKLLLDLERQLAGTDKNLDTKMSRIDNLNAKLSEKDLRIVELERKLSNTGKSIELKEDEHKRRLKETEDLESLVKELNKKIAKAQTNAVSLKENVQDSKQEYKLQVDKNDDLIKNLAATNKMSEKTDSEVDDLKKAIQNITDEIALLERRLASSKHEIEKNKEFRKIELERNIANITKSIELKDNDNKSKTKELAGIDSQIKSLRTKQTKSERLSKELAGEFKTAKRNFQLENDRMDNQLNEQAIVKKVLAESKIEADSLNRSLDRYNETGGNLAKKISSTKQEIEKLRSIRNLWSRN